MSIIYSYIYTYIYFYVNIYTFQEKDKEIANDKQVGPNESG